MGIGKSVAKIRVYFAKRELKTELAKVIDLMEGHKEASRPSGNWVYKTLDGQATKAIKAYQAKCTLLGFQKPECSEIEVGAPKLRELSTLASGKVEKSPVGGYVLITIFGGGAITVLMAFYHDLYLLLTYTANMHWR